MVIGLTALVAASLLLAACGGSSGAPPADSMYSISASVSGLASGNSLVLQDNGTDDLTFTANSTTKFSTPLAGGATYSVTLLTQPAGESCTVSGSSGLSPSIRHWMCSMTPASATASIR